MSRRLAAVAQAVLSSLVVSTVPMGAGAQVEAPFQNREEREIYGDTNGSGSILDAANPMDLLNQIRRATAMDDAPYPPMPLMRPSRPIRTLQRRRSARGF